MKQKVLITGASGFVGKHLVKEAQKNGFEVHAAVRKTSNLQPIKEYIDAFKYLDYEAPENMKGLLRKEQYSYIIHAAALTTAKTEEQMQKVNVEFTLTLVEAAFESCPNLIRFVYVSSLAAIGPVKFADLPITEKTPYHPITMYGRSKKISEQILYNKYNKYPITIVRPTAVYGPEERDIFMVFKTMNKGFDPYIGRKPQKLSFVYVADLVDALLSACSPADPGIKCYNITDGKVYLRYDMAEIYKGVFNKKLLRVHIPVGIVRAAAELMQIVYRKSDKTPILYPERIQELTAESWACDITSAVEELAYKPKYDLDKGLKRTLRWYKENNWL
ncbi:MAG TPA: NAD(P)-dependent oxidoreductase [Sphingobacterium sp.]|nr:NAD(P)-dependent oxidoreductase [Sphingobacterium sp.]